MILYSTAHFQNHDFDLGFHARTQQLHYTYSSISRFGSRTGMTIEASTVARVVRAVTTIIVL